MRQVSLIRYDLDSARADTLRGIGYPLLKKGKGTGSDAGSGSGRLARIMPSRVTAIVVTCNNLRHL